MKRNANHILLDQAKLNKKDEFYTQLVDIERELQYYSIHFNNKIVYCNCDDMETSNFFKYFVKNFKNFGIKKIICSCYKKSPKGLGAYFEYTGGTINYNDVKYFSGDGDFRSLECTKLLEQSDIVVTNPPFSLFREYIAQLIDYNKKFLVISNINAITYKEIFNLIKDNKAWLGINFGRGISGFIVPEYYELYGQETGINEKGERIVSPNNCMWLTNLNNSKRQGIIPLTKRYAGNEKEYPHYDNCKGINVNRTINIPFDYDGLIGVPITFLHKFNPKQFEIIKFRKGDDGKDLRINGKSTYFRILIRNKSIKKYNPHPDFSQYEQQKIDFSTVNSAK